MQNGSPMQTNSIDVVISMRARVCLLDEDMEAALLHAGSKQPQLLQVRLGGLATVRVRVWVCVR